MENTEVTADTTATDNTAGQADGGTGNWIDSVKDNPEFQALQADAAAFKGVEKAPEKPEDYKVEVEGLKDEQKAEIAKLAHKMGLTNSQVPKFAEALTEALTQNNAARQELVAKERENMKASSKETLGKIWGRDVEKNEDAARSAITKWGDPELFKVLDDSGLIYHPSILSTFHRIGSIGMPDVLIPGGNPQGQPAPVDNSGKVHVEYQK